MLALDLESNTLPGPTLPSLPQQGEWVSHMSRLVEEHHTKVGGRGQPAHHQVSCRRPQEVPLTPRVHPVGVLQQHHVPGRTHTGHHEHGSAEVARGGAGSSEVRVGEHNLEDRVQSDIFILEEPIEVNSNVHILFSLGVTYRE